MLADGREGVLADGHGSDQRKGVAGGEGHGVRCGDDPVVSARVSGHPVQLFSKFAAVAVRVSHRPRGGERSDGVWLNLSP